MRVRRFDGRAMGSALHLTVIGGSQRESVAARDAAWAEMAAADAELSRFRTDSALSRANAMAGSGQWFDAPPRLRRMLTAAHRAHLVSEGRFDPRVIGVLEAIGEAGGVILPQATASEGPWMERTGRTSHIRLAAPVDSGGIGKGLGLRWALAAAMAAAPRVAGLLLEAGGDVVAAGSGPDGGPWSIGVEDPRQPGQLLAVVALRAGAVATSSTAFRSWTHEGRPVHHLIDPSSAEPADTGLTAVTVATSDPAWAEVWTKALFLAGRAGIGDEARRRGLAAWWVEDDGSLHLSPVARVRTTWTRDEAPAA